MTLSSAFAEKRRAIRSTSAARNASGPEPAKATHGPRACRTYLPLNPALIPVHASTGAPPASSSSLFPRPLLPLQRKLAIGSTTDPLEAEADRVADQVMKMSAPAPQIAASAAAPALRRKCSCEDSGEECPECREKSEETLQLKAVSTVTPTEAPPIVHRVLRSPGQPLDSATRSFFEPRLGHDLSHVRVHTDAQAAESAHEVQALAYAVGDNVAFAAGQYSPHSAEGRKLLAHELAHVGQQRAGAATGIQRKPQSGTDVKLASSRGKAVVEKLEKAGKLSKGMRNKINRDLRFFKGAAKQAYLKEVKPELVEVEVSLFPDNSGIIPSAKDIELGGEDPTAEMAEDFGSVSDDDLKAGKNLTAPQESPRYIDNLFESVDQKSLNGAVTFHWKEGGKEQKLTVAAADFNQSNPNSTLADANVYHSKAEALKGADRTAKDFGSMASFYYSYYETSDGVIVPTSFFQGSTPKLYALWPDLAKLAQLTAEEWDDTIRGWGMLANAINPFPCTEVDENGKMRASINLGNCALPILLHGYSIHSATHGPGSSVPKNEPNTGVRPGHVPDQVDTGSPSNVKPETKPATPPPEHAPQVEKPASSPPPKQAQPVDKPATPPPPKQAPPVDKPATTPPPKEAPPAKKPATAPPPKQAPPVDKPATTPPKQKPPAKKPAVKPPKADTTPAGGGGPAKKPDTQPAKGQGGTTDKPSAPAHTTPDTAKPSAADPDISRPATDEQKPPEADKDKTDAPPVDKAKRVQEIDAEIAKNDAEMKKLDGKIKEAADRANEAGQKATSATGDERVRLQKKARRNKATADNLQLERGKVRARNQDLYDEKNRLTRPPDPETWQQAEDYLRDEFHGRKETIEVNDKLGERDVDCYTSDGVAREAKHGGPFDTTDSRIQLELAKDKALLQSKKVTAVEWHFYKNPETGGVGPTARLEKALQDAGIKVVRH